MSGGRVLVLFVCGAALLAAPGNAPSQSSAQSARYVLKQDDELPALADALRPPKATAAQMAVALVRANQKVMYDRGSSHRLAAGTVLAVPDEATVLKIDPAVAETEFSRMWRAEQHYRAAVALEKSHDMFYAFSSYVMAAKLGHGLAQLRLGQLYDRDFTGFVSHDLMESAHWYQEARDNQVRVGKPSAYFNPAYPD